MAPYHDDPRRRLQLHVGRADAVLPTLAAGSVHPADPAANDGG